MRITEHGARNIGDGAHLGCGFSHPRDGSTRNLERLRLSRGRVGDSAEAPPAGTRSNSCMSEVVVVGNGVSGFACAARLAEQGAPVIMVGPGLPHDRPPLSKRALATGRVPLLADAAQLVERGIAHVDGVVRRSTSTAGSSSSAPAAEQPRS